MSRLCGLAPPVRINPMKIRFFPLPGIVAALGPTLSVLAPARAQAILSTEDFLNCLGTNTHLNGLTKDDPWNTDAARLGPRAAPSAPKPVREVTGLNPCSLKVQAPAFAGEDA